MLVFAWAIESKRSPSSGGVRKIPGHPKAESQAECLSPLQGLYGGESKVA